MSTVVEYGWRRVAVVSAVMLAALLQLADTTIVNVALPTMDGGLGASTDEGAWFVTAYIVANVIVIPLSPWLQSLFGRRNYFALSIAGFTVTSVLCGLANDTNSEIALRFIQGAFGGGLMVPAQQIIRDTYPPKLLGTSQTLFALAVTIGPTIGPTLGGILTDDASWRWVFFINVIPGIIATLLVLMFLRDPETPPANGLDIIGIAFLAVGLGSLQYVLDEGERYGWFDDSNNVLIAIIAGVGLTAFVLWELFGTKVPAVALRVLRQRSVWAMSVANFFIGISFFGLIFVLPIYTQNVLGFTTTDSGLAMMFRAGTAVLLFPVINAIVQRPDVDLRLVAAAGIGITAIVTWVQSFVITSGTSFAALLPTQIAGGLGFSLLFVPLNVALFRSLEPVTIPASLALTRLFQQIGGSVGSALTVTLLDRFGAAHQAALAGSVALSNMPVRAFMDAHGSHSIQALAYMVEQETQSLATADTLRFFAVVLACAAALPLLFRRVHTKA